MSTPSDMGHWMTYLLTASGEDDLEAIDAVKAVETTNADESPMFTRPEDPVLLTLYQKYGKGLWGGQYRGSMLYR